MKDYASIRSYEDACVALGESVNEVALTEAGASAAVIAQMKCALVARAINGGERIAFSNEAHTYIPFFVDYTSIQSLCRFHSFWKNGEAYVAPMRKTDGTDAFLCGCRVGVVDSDCIDCAYPHIIRFESEGKAYHFGKYFMGLWAQAYLPDWDVDESRLIRIDVAKDAPEEKERNDSQRCENFGLGVLCGVISILIFCLGMQLLRLI